MTHFQYASSLLYATCLLAPLAIVARTQAQSEPVPATVDDEATFEATDGEVLVQYPDSDDADQQSPAERAEALKRRAGERIGGDPRGKAAVLGMYVQEGDRERLKVIEVAAASPAFDAGVRKGDVITSFDNFKAETYRKWVDGIRRLVKDAPEGQMIPVQIVRAGQTYHLQLRKPVAQADDSLPDDELSITQELILPQQQAPQFAPPVQQPSSGANVGVIGDFSNTNVNAEAAASGLRAAAEIYRLNATAQVPQGRRPPAGGARSGTTLGTDQPTAQPAGDTNGVGGQRIGLAGFGDSSTGLNVMLDVGGLEPGNYMVGIDAAAIAGPPGAPGGVQDAGQRDPQLATPGTEGVDESGGANADSTGPGIGPAIMLGLLTVDESGTGRMQQNVEGIQVQSIVGQAIVIYMQQFPANDNTLPSNLDVSSPIGQSSGTQPTQQADVVPQQQGGALPQPNGSPTPIAAGAIQLLTDPAPAAAGNPVGQPAATLPATGDSLR